MIGQVAETGMPVSVLGTYEQAPGISRLTPGLGRTGCGEFFRPLE
jgi:hypothetical protein